MTCPIEQIDYALTKWKTFDLQSNIYDSSLSEFLSTICLVSSEHWTPLRQLQETGNIALKKSFEQPIGCEDGQYYCFAQYYCPCHLTIVSHEYQDLFLKLFTDTIKRDFALHGDPSGRLSLKQKVDLCREKLPIRKIGD